jgi:His Kinase A (phospho-acceptor) domain
MKALPNADAERQHEPEPTADQGVRRAVAGCEDCGELLHGLNNALASVLLNAQVMAWKLPSYSRGKRYLHEIERNAQRGGELVKRLLERSQADCHIGQCPGHSGTEATVVGLDGAALSREGNVSAQPVEQGTTP